MKILACKILVKIINRYTMFFLEDATLNLIFGNPTMLWFLIHCLEDTYDALTNSVVPVESHPQVVFIQSFKMFLNQIF